MKKTELLDSHATHKSVPKIVRARDGDCLELAGEGRVPLLEAADTGGAMALALANISPGAGAPLHLHTREDELFWVESGEFEIHIGDQQHTLKSGDFAFGPRGVLHSYTSRSEGGALLVGLVRAGFEKFFRDIADQASEAPLSRRDTRALALRYGVHIGSLEELNALCKPSRAPKIVRSKDGECLEVWGGSARLLLSSQETSGALCVAEVETPSLLGMREQVHSSLDIAFAILAGRYEFCLDDARVQATRGDVLWIPCGTPHSFRVMSPAPGRALMLSASSGLDDFLRAATLQN